MNFTCESIRLRHLPNDDGSIFGACDHDAVVVSKVENGFGVVHQRVDLLALFWVPNSNC